MSLLAYAALVLLSLQSAESGIDVQVRVTPDTVVIGQRFVLTVTVSGIEGVAEVQFPELPDTGAVAALTPPQALEEPGAATRTAVYQLAAWTVGGLATPTADVRVRTDAAELTIPLPGVDVHVMSVLPAAADPDTLAWEPPADVAGPSWSLAEKIAVAGLALALLAGALLLLRRRGMDQPIPQAAPRPASQSALEALDLLAEIGLLEAGELKAFYSALSHIIRRFLSESEPEWGLELTTEELLAIVGEDGVESGSALTLAGLLEGSDLVKFARRRPTRAQAGRALDATRRWVVEFERVIPEPEPEVEEEIEVQAVMSAEEELAEIEKVFAEETAESAATSEADDLDRWMP
jgi:hypothetical protein